MKIHITEHQITYPGSYVMGASMARCITPDRPGYGSLIMVAGLLDGSDSGIGNMMWRSYDEGKTWQQEGFIEKSFQCDRVGSRLKFGGTASVYTDEKAGVLLFIDTDMYWYKNEITKKCSRPYYRLSFDNGNTWTDKRYIVTKGYTLDNPIPDVIYGRNFSLSVQSQTRRTEDDSLLVALQCQMVDENDNLIEPAGYQFFQAGALHAIWNEEQLGYDWEMSEYVTVDTKQSLRGVFEPTFARLKANTYIMIMRNSNMGDQKVIGQKFYAVSKDNGHHWSEAKPLQYDDGNTMYASSNLPRILEHSNGKLYYIGIINESNPSGNLPRAPMCIAELDRSTCTILKNTVTVIDNVREHHTEQIKAGTSIHLIDYTNHGVYEDPDGRIIMYAPFRTDLSKWECGLNRYEIDVN